jgi:2-methylcitrate dehydratase PrpD
VGAAAAGARLLDGHEAVATDAVAHAASVAGGAATAIIERTATRFLHRAHAVTTGLACARVAAAGRPGARGILADGRGALVLTHPARLTAPRSSSALEETGFRLRQATGFAHSALDAADSLAPLEGIAHVRVGVSPAAAALASNPRPATADEVWWSIEHSVAGALSVPISCVEVQGTADGWAATVDVQLRDGSMRSAAVTEPLGHPGRPASDDDLRAKWSRLTGDDGDAALRRLERAGDADSFALVVGDLVGWNRFQ